MQAQGVQPADLTTDWEFIRRVTLDLTGRIPTSARVLAFVADTTPDKRAKLVDELLASPQWVDKWTMYFGDLYQNTDQRPSTSLRRFPAGRNAFYKWIHDSLDSGKPYNQMATEMITATGPNSYTQGELNWILNGYITGGPQQDITDSMAANVSDSVPGHLPHELPALPQRPRASGPVEPVGLADHPLPGLGFRLLPLADNLTSASITIPTTATTITGR